MGVCPTHPKETLVAPLPEELPISVYVKRSETKEPLALLPSPYSASNGQSESEVQDGLPPSSSLDAVTQKGSLHPICSLVEDEL